MNKVLGIFLIVLGLALAIVPSFTDNSSHGIYMNMGGMLSPLADHFGGQAEIAIGTPLVIIGVMFTFTKRKSGFLMLSILGLVLSAFAIALPTILIGTTGDPTQPGNTIMKPAIMVIASLAILWSLGGLVLMGKAKS